jgi:mRNA interferase MazF
MSASALEFGDIVLLPFPFTNQAPAKKRPAVIVSNRAYNRTKPDAVVMAITSQFRPNVALGEVWLGQWPAAGLLKPSVVKPLFVRQRGRQEVHPGYPGVGQSHR